MIPRGLLTLLSGGAVSQIIILAVVPVLARLYDAAAFGQLAGVMAMVSLAAVIVHGRYQMAIPVADSEEDARALLLLALCCIAVLSGPVVWLVWLAFGEVPKGMSLTGFFALTIALTALTAASDVMAYWRSRMARFGVSSRNSIVRAVVTVGVQISAVSLSPLALVLGTLAGVGSAAALGLIDMLCVDRGRKKELPKASLFNPHSALGDVAARYQSYPLFGVPQGWLAAVSWNAMPLLLLRFVDTASAGQYWIAYRLLIAPVTLFGQAYRQVMLPNLRGKTRSEGAAMARPHFFILLAAGAIPAAILFFSSDILFPLVLGQGWSMAAQMAAWLGLGVWADGFKIPAICLLQAQGRQKAILVWEALIVAVRYAIALTFLLRGDAVAAIAAFALAGLIGWLLFSLANLIPKPWQIASDT